MKNKKILFLLGSLSMISITGITIASCNTKQEKIEESDKTIKEEISFLDWFKTVFSSVDKQPEMSIYKISEYLDEEKFNYSEINKNLDNLITIYKSPVKIESTWNMRQRREIPEFVDEFSRIFIKHLYKAKSYELKDNTKESINIYIEQVTNSINHYGYELYGMENNYDEYLTDSLKKVLGPDLIEQYGLSF
jgi:transposase